MSRGKADWRKCFVGGSHTGRKDFAGVGAHGTVHPAVWKASRTGHGTQVAIKRMKKQRTRIKRAETLSTSTSNSDGSGVVATMTDEMKFFRDLRHANIVECFGILEEHEDPADKTSPLVKSIVTERCFSACSVFSCTSNLHELHLLTVDYISRSATKCIH